MRKLKYFFAIAAFIMFAGADTHWVFAVLGVMYLAGVIFIQQLEHENRGIALDNDLYEHSNY